MELREAIELFDNMAKVELFSIREAWKTIREKLMPGALQGVAEAGSGYAGAEPKGVIKWRYLLSKMKEGENVTLSTKESDAFQNYTQKHGGETHSRRASDCTRIVFLLKKPDRELSRVRCHTERWDRVLKTAVIGVGIALPSSDAEAFYQYIKAHGGEAHTRRSSDDTRAVFILKFPQHFTI